MNQTIRINVLRVLFLLAVPLMLFTRSAWSEVPWLYEVLEVLGAFLIISAVLGRFWSILYIGGHKNKQVMQDGPYSTCRHPLYFFSMLGIVGFGMMLGSIVLTSVIAVLSLVVFNLTAAREEAFLRSEFGPAYDEYAARVPRLLPRPSLFRSPPQVTFSVTGLRRNLNDALVFLAMIPLAEFLEVFHEYGLVPTAALW